MSKEFRLKLEKVFDFIGEVLAFVVAVVWVLVVLNANFHFMDGVPVITNIFNFMLHWGLLIFVGVVGLEATIKRNFLIRIFFYLLLAVLIIFYCFPDTYTYLVGFVPA